MVSLDLASAFKFQNKQSYAKSYRFDFSKIKKDEFALPSTEIEGGKKSREFKKYLNGKLPDLFTYFKRSRRPQEEEKNKASGFITTW